jgi:hypothetical protein
MDPDTEGSGELEAYWRRRAIALVGVLASVGLLAWACSGSDDKKSTLSAMPPMVGSPSPSPNGTAARPPGGQPNASPGAVVPTVTVTATAKVTVVPTVPKKAGDACDPADVVVDLVKTKDEFTDKEHPQFRLSVVNTGQQACTLDVGPRQLQILIGSGPYRVWSSARCLADSGSSIQMLPRGIPYVAGVEWDRTRSVSGACSGHRDRAVPGTYMAIAREGKIKSRRQVFRLR